ALMIPASAFSPGTNIRLQEVRGMSAFFCNCVARIRHTLGFAVVMVLLSWCGQAAAQLTPDQQADMLLDAAKRAYNEKKYPFAATKFQEFITKYGNHKDLPAARYGLALALVDGPDKDYQKAWENLQPLMGA